MQSGRKETLDRTAHLGRHMNVTVAEADLAAAIGPVATQVPKSETPHCTRRYRRYTLPPL